jgi:hypothetical protein
MNWGDAEEGGVGRQATASELILDADEIQPL